MVCEAVDLCLNSTKMPKDLKQEVQNISCAILEEEDINENKIVSGLNAVSTFEHVTPKQMAEEQQKDPTLELVYQLVTAGEKPKTLAITKIKSKAVRKYLLQFNRLTLKKGVLHRLYIHNDVEFHQMILLIKFQAMCFNCFMMAKVIRGLKELLPYARSNSIGIPCSKMQPNM